MPRLIFYKALIQEDRSFVCGSIVLLALIQALWQLKYFVDKIERIQLSARNSPPQNEFTVLFAFCVRFFRKSGGMYGLPLPPLHLPLSALVVLALIGYEIRKWVMSVKVFCELVARLSRKCEVMTYFIFCVARGNILSISYFWENIPKLVYFYSKVVTYLFLEEVVPADFFFFQNTILFWYVFSYRMDYTGSSKICHSEVNLSFCHCAATLY